MKRAVLGVVTLVAAVGLLAGGFVIGNENVLGFKDAIAVEEDGRHTQILQAVNREEQVVLTSLAIQGIVEETASTTLWGHEIFGTERAVFLQYTLSAKLGVEGADVVIEQTGENEFLVTIPEFIFIGHDDVEFRMLTENGGALSWVTPDVDTVEMVNDVLRPDALDQYVDEYRDILQDQARVFYSGIISGIDPTAVVAFDFAGGR